MLTISVFGKVIDIERLDPDKIHTLKEQLQHAVILSQNELDKINYKASAEVIKAYQRKKGWQ